MRLNAKDAVASVTIVRKADEVDGDEELRRTRRYKKVKIFYETVDRGCVH